MEIIKVLHIVTDMKRGGLETMIMNYYRHINRSKIQFDFLTHREYRGDYDDEIESLGGRVYHIPRLVPWNRSYKQALRVFFLSHPEYRIIHVHQDCLSGVICKVAKECGIQIRVAHSHSASQDKNLKYPIKLWYKRSIPKYATDLLACGQKAGEWMFSGAPFQIMNNAIDTDTYVFNPVKRAEVRAHLGLTDKYVVGHVGRFFYPKNHPFLLKIFAEVLKREPNAILLLVGGGPDMPKIQVLADRLGITEKVRFLGVRNDVADLLQAMDVFVFPSRYEGLPVTLIEAQAAGLPCIISARVPNECIITEQVTVLSLEEELNVWSATICAKQKSERSNTQAIIKNAGYDIGTNADWLLKKYLQYAEK